jgi:hypoxanthine-DNA glycosylase
MQEFHPFLPFVPAGATVLLLGTFPGRETTQTPPGQLNPEVWSYRGPRNQCWPILSLIYGLPVATRAQKEALLAANGLALADVILACRRRDNTNGDDNLVDIVWNQAAIGAIIGSGQIRQVLCTSKMAEKAFKQWHPGFPCATLPSPSPRYARLRMEQKAEIWREMLGGGDATGTRP